VGIPSQKLEESSESRTQLPSSSSRDIGKQALFLNQKR